MPGNATHNQVTFAAALRRLGNTSGEQTEGAAGEPMPALWLKTSALFLGAFLLYFLTRTPGLDEFDSVNFAMGVTRGFNLWQDQPHAPGYPLFIFLGWLGRELFGATPEASLHFVSAVGGALLVTAWFGIVRLQFNEKLAWWVALCLAITPAVWMAATKVLTDTLAAGFISLELLGAVLFLRGGRRTPLLLMSLGGAAAVGTRPQLILVAVIILWTALRMRRAPANVWAASFMIFAGACLLWLLPTCYLQWRIHPELSPWLVYPQLLYKQWQWRLDKPGTYVGAGDWSLRYLGARTVYHLAGWFSFGFGFARSIFTISLGGLIALAGLGSYFWRSRETADREFWRLHRWWALAHIAIIFISLSAAQRYYLIIFPLLLVALLRGFMRLPSPWSRATALLFPALLLYIVIPLAIQNSRDDAPAVRLVTFLKEIYPPERRPEVVLLFTKARRHVEWYAPQFVTYRNTPAPDDLPQRLAHASAVYTDDAKLPLPAGWRRIPLAVFARSPVIYMKDHFLELYLVERPPQARP
jgi:hypothetical protein